MSFFSNNVHVTIVCIPVMCLNCMHLQYVTIYKTLAKLLNEILYYVGLQPVNQVFNTCGNHSLTKNPDAPQGSAWETLSGGQNSISKTLLFAKWTLSYIKNTVNRVKH